MFGMLGKSDKKPSHLIKVGSFQYAGMTRYRYTVECAETGRDIASGWCETEDMARQMVDRIVTPSKTE